MPIHLVSVCDTCGQGIASPPIETQEHAVFVSSAVMCSGINPITCGVCKGNKDAKAAESELRLSALAKKHLEIMKARGLDA